jgi:hypothetical protein
MTEELELYLAYTDPFIESEKVWRRKHFPRQDMELILMKISFQKNSIIGADSSPPCSYICHCTSEHTVRKPDNQSINY